MADGDNDSGIQELSASTPNGARMGAASTDLIGFLGVTPITQKSAGIAAPQINPAVSGSTLVASIHSIAIGAASLANVNAAILASFGLTD